MKKFYNKYSSLFDYKVSFFEDFYNVVIFVPKKENYLKHLENIGRLLQVEFGGVYKIVYRNEEERVIETDIPYNIYYGIFHTDDFLDKEKNDKIERFWIYKKSGEKPIQSLW